ncbi:MAG: hypothetical protein AAF226_05855 [Verrucomicrobiota bacterium]
MNLNTSVAGLTSDEIPEEIYSGFCDYCRGDGDFDVQVIKKPSEPMAGIIELLPAAIAVYLAKPFFDSFLKSLGSDAYTVVKDKLSKILLKSKSINSIALASSDLKVSEPREFSRVFSIHSNSIDGRPIKFLMPLNPSEDESQQIVGALIDDMNAYFSDDANSTIRMLISDSTTRGIMYFRYSFEAATWEELSSLEIANS